MGAVLLHSRETSVSRATFVGVEGGRWQEMVSMLAGVVTTVLDICLKARIEERWNGYFVNSTSTCLIVYKLLLSVICKNWFLLNSVETNLRQIF